LDGANLYGADLSNASLSGATLKDALLSHANLFGAFLNRADLSGAKLRFATLKNAELKDAQFFSADLEGALFEPKSLPLLEGIAAARNLDLMQYDVNPDAMTQLRKRFTDTGLREQERKITYALKRVEAGKAWERCTAKWGDVNESLWASDGRLANCLSSVFNRIFFDWTCQYGMSPGRPLFIGFVLWFACSVLYSALVRPPWVPGSLFRIYPPDFLAGPTAQQSIESVWHPHGRPRLFLACMFFSLMSAFNIGFRDINFGRWLRSLTREEFDMKATGWVRVVAGWQSLISVFLIALWVLTYFGRPFG
jgi:hypothetical protein